MTLKIAIQKENLCTNVLFSLLKKFISKLEYLCADTGECAIVNVELAEACEDGRVLQQARFELVMADTQVIHIAASAKTMEDAIYNAFDACELELGALEKRA